MSGIHKGARGLVVYFCELMVCLPVFVELNYALLTLKAQSRFRYHEHESNEGT